MTGTWVRARGHWPTKPASAPSGPSFQRKEGEARMASIARFILSAWHCTAISHSSKAFIRSQRANPLKPVKTYFSFLSAAMSSSWLTA